MKLSKSSCLGRMNDSTVQSQGVMTYYDTSVLSLNSLYTSMPPYSLVNSLYTRIPPYSLVNFSKFPVTLHKLLSVLGVSRQNFCPRVAK